jgi:hypothetical protein
MSCFLIPAKVNVDVVNATGSELPTTVFPMNVAVSDHVPPEPTYAGMRSVAVSALAAAVPNCTVVDPMPKKVLLVMEKLSCCAEVRPEAAVQLTETAPVREGGERFEMGAVREE